MGTQGKGTKREEEKERGWIGVRVNQAVVVIPSVTRNLLSRRPVEKANFFSPSK
jgi:hypothetical protein